MDCDYEELWRPPRLKKGGAATKDEAERIARMNVLFKTFNVDVYLWFSAGDKSERRSKPFYLTWKRWRGASTQHKFFSRIRDAENAGHALISTLEPID